MAEVDCVLHGRFEYSSDACPRCSLSEAEIREKDEQRAQDELRARAHRERVITELRVLTKQTRSLHQLGEAGLVYEEHLLLGAADLCGRRYAQIQAKTRVLGATAPITYVPWIDVFAEHLNELVTIHWKPHETVYVVKDDDGIIESG